MSVLQAALDLAARGVPVFPCMSAPGDKKRDKAPACEGGFYAASTDADTVRRLFDNPAAVLIGVPTGAASGLDVLDLDPRHGSDAWWNANQHRIPATLIHDTRSGGKHLVFSHQPGMRCSAGLLAPGCDVRADGGYVIHWPSAGCPVWLDDDPQPWPAWVLAGLATRPISAEPRDISAIAPPSAAAVVDLLTNLPNPVSAGRDTYAQVMLAARGCEQATPDDDAGGIGAAAVAWAYRWEAHDGTDEQAKWDSDWAHRDAPLAGWQTLLQVARKLIPGFVDVTAGGEFEALPELPPAPRRKLFVSRDFRVSLNEPYVIKHLIAPGNVCVLVGQPGAGKSTLAPHLAYAVAQGRRVFGMRTTPGRALYIAAEDLKGVEKRIGALGLRHGHTDDCTVMGCGNLRDPGECAAVFAVVADFKPALIVLDTVAAAFAGIDENTSQDMGHVVQFARRLAATGAAVVLVHHPAKNGDGSPRGHGSLNGTLDMTLTLAPDDVHDPDTIVRGQTPKNRNGTTARDFAFRKEVITLGVDADGDPITTTLPMELDASGCQAAKAAKLSQTEAAAMGALHSLLDRTGVDQVAEDAWLDACIPLSAAETPKDRARSARRMVAKLAEKGAVRIANGTVSAGTAAKGCGPAGTKRGPSQGVEFIERTNGDQTGTEKYQQGEIGDGGDHTLSMVPRSPRLRDKHATLGQGAYP